MIKKYLLLDIDYTLFDELTPRPYLKEFILAMHECYNIHFYTAATHKRVVEVARIMKHELGIDPEIVRHLNRYSLNRDNCRMIEHRVKEGWEIQIKCFKKAAEILETNKSELILLDDNPSFDHPDCTQIIQAEGFMQDMIEDDYLLRLMDILKG